MYVLSPPNRSKGFLRWTPTRSRGRATSCTNASIRGQGRISRPPGSTTMPGEQPARGCQGRCNRQRRLSCSSRCGLAERKAGKGKRYFWVGIEPKEPNDFANEPPTPRRTATFCPHEALDPLPRYRNGQRTSLHNRRSRWPRLADSTLTAEETLYAREAMSAANDALPNEKAKFHSLKRSSRCG